MYKRQGKGGKKGSPPAGDAPKGKGKGPDGDLLVNQKKDNSLDPCIFYQSKFNGGQTCKYPKWCIRPHRECKNQEEYDAIPKPANWKPTTERKATPRDTASPRDGPKGGKGGKGGKPDAKAKATPKAKAFVFAQRADYGTFCKAFGECPGRIDGGDGTCLKAHTTKQEANAIITKFKEAEKKSRNDAKSPRNGQ